MRNLCVRVGEAGELESFGDDWQGALAYLNALGVGRVLRFKAGGLDTTNYHGDDGVAIYWGNASGGHDLSEAERERLLTTLSECEG